MHPPDGLKLNITEAWVSETRLAMLKEAVAKYAKKSMKLGLEPMKLSVAGERMVRFWLVKSQMAGFRDAFEARPFDWLPSRIEAIGMSRTDMLDMQYKAVLEGGPPHVKGWRILAKLEHEDGGNIIKSFDGAVVPSEFMSAIGNCDHCGVKRTRQSTYLLRKEGEMPMQVGGTCLVDFTGHPNAESMAQLASFRSSIIDLMEPSDPTEWTDSDGTRSSAYKEIGPYLARVAQLVRAGGYLKGDSFQMGTKDEALYALKHPDKYPKLTDDDEALANDALSWARGISDEEAGSSSLMNNYRVISTSGVFCVDPRRSQAGYAASIIPAYQHSLRAGRELAEKAASDWVGAEGEKRSASGVLLVSVIASDGLYGKRFVHKFRDAEGNTLVWFAGRDDLQEGDVYDIAFTVKSHGEYRGEKQTTVLRVKATRSEATTQG